MAEMDRTNGRTFAHGATRFAPSPTGELHLGNARTALFNFLLARRGGERFVLRIEDTDAARSRPEHIDGVLADLVWLGLEWDAGPGREDALGPYFQSQRGTLYAREFAELERQGAVYPCYCTALELEVARRTQRAAGRAPRYPGTCRELTASEREHKRAAGLPATLRFRVPGGRRIEFTDLVHGPQSFLSDEIGDFIIRRADGAAAFFFSNAVDDATMGVTQVLRGEDHLPNTPRQLLILEALGRRAPRYGHLSLILGSDGAPLSKRHGAASVREFRERGYRPEALVNYLFRLGHSSPEHGLLELEGLARAFDIRHLGRAPAHFDEQQLRVWQKTAAHRLSGAQARAWLGSRVPAGISAAAAEAFSAAVLPNVVLPEDAQPWAEIIFGGAPPLDAEGETIVREAGGAFFAAAARAAAMSGNDLAAIAAAARAASGRKGAQLYRPLRFALTGLGHGPELAPLLAALPAGEAERRLARFA
jgi:nondiscriminating glutamyl-tRNA synthetase